MVQSYKLHHVQLLNFPLSCLFFKLSVVLIVAGYAGAQMWHKLTFIPHILIFRRNLIGNNFSSSSGGREERL